MIIYVYISILLFIRIHVCRYLPTVMPPFNSHSFTVTMQVTPQTPLQKATQLVNKVLKDVNECRTHGICLRVICGGHEPWISKFGVKSLDPTGHSEEWRFQAEAHQDVVGPDWPAQRCGDQAGGMRGFAPGLDWKEEIEKQALCGYHHRGNPFTTRIQCIFLLVIFSHDCRVWKSRVLWT